MKIIKKIQAHEFKGSDQCVVFEYQAPYKDINGSLAKINGRYPEKGCAINQICRELGYVINGQGKIVIKDKEILLSKGDLVFIDPLEKFYWQGNLELFLVCAPTWTPKQHKFIE